jgi:CheY-like chemotaxis protein
MGKELYGIKILVVDDDADTRELLEWVLKRTGAEVVLAASAKEALEAVERSKPQVLVSDIAMPEEDGYSLVRKIRAMPAERGGRIPAVALTASDSRETRLQSREAGFHYHLTKPADPAQLVEIVAALVRLTSR